MSVSTIGALVARGRDAGAEIHRKFTDEVWLHHKRLALSQRNAAFAERAKHHARSLLGAAAQARERAATRAGVPAAVPAAPIERRCGCCGYRGAGHGHRGWTSRPAGAAARIVHAHHAALGPVVPTQTGGAARRNTSIDRAEVISSPLTVTRCQPAPHVERQRRVVAARRDRALPTRDPRAPLQAIARRRAASERPLQAFCGRQRTLGARAGQNCSAAARAASPSSRRFGVIASASASVPRSWAFSRSSRRPRASRRAP